MIRRNLTLLYRSSRFDALPRGSLGLRYTGERNYRSDLGHFKSEADVNEVDISASTTGVLDFKKGSEIVFYFDHVYPYIVSKLNQKIGSVIVKTWYGPDKLKANIMHLANSEESPLDETAKIIEFVPLPRDGGAFAKFSIPKHVSARDFIKQVISNFKRHEDTYNSNYVRRLSNSIWNHFPGSFPVKGTPWIEDLRRYPSKNLKVIFEGPPLTEEELYLLFRRYGMMHDIVPASSSTPFAKVTYNNVRSAICAKNCITGVQLNENKTSLHLQYIPFQRDIIKDFIVNHQRISIPIIIALLAACAVLVFDPIREWFMIQKVTRRYSIDRDNRYIRFFYTPYQMMLDWITSGYDYIDQQFQHPDEPKLDMFVRNNEEDYSALWDERQELSRQLKLWIYENVNTYIIVRGPKGSGKEEFVLDNTLKRDPQLKNKILYIDCESLFKARSDTALLKNCAYQLGYFPLFTWVNGISQFIDLGVQSMTGQKSGLSESKEAQLQNMFSLSLQTLRSVALDDYDKYKMAVKKNRAERLKKEGDNSLLGIEDENLREEDYLQQFPEAKSIVVIGKYSKSYDTKNSFVHKMIADWTSQLVQSNLAHVIYITNDVGSLEYLTESLPNQVFKTVALYDASQKNAKQFLVSQLGEKFRKDESLDACLDPLGGRMLDLQAYIRRIRSGEGPEEAVAEMVNQAAEQITTFFLNHSSAVSNGEVWIPSQVWVIIKLLSQYDKVTFEQLLQTSIFGSSSEAYSTLTILENHDLICLKREKGLLESICSGRPLFKAAFKELVKDRMVYKLFETAYLNQLISKEVTKVRNLEDELSKIKDLKLEIRVPYLIDKINASSQKIKDYETQVKALDEYRGKEKSRSFLGF